MTSAGGGGPSADLTRLAALLAAKNQADSGITALIGRPSQIGHLGEWIAARVFDIELHASAATAASDGVFRSGAPAGRTVNVKWYGRVFEHHAVIEDLSARRHRIGIASSVRRDAWDRAEIHPTGRCPLLQLTDRQRAMIAMFAPELIA